MIQISMQEGYHYFFLDKLKLSNRYSREDTKRAIYMSIPYIKGNTNRTFFVLHALHHLF
jgi:hypothetical protein